jgi:hypothetical protein
MRVTLGREAFTFNVTRFGAARIRRRFGLSKCPVLVKSFLPRGVSVLIRDSLLRPDVTPQQRLGHNEGVSLAVLMGQLRVDPIGGVVGVYAATA